MPDQQHETRGCKQGCTQDSRLGPRPLALHMATQTMTWTSSLAALPSLKNGSLNWSPDLSPSLQDAARELQKRLVDIAPDTFAAAVDAEARRRLMQFADGVIAYRDRPRQDRPPEPPCVWQQGSTRLLDYGTGNDGPPILFVPSLINRSYILDLSEKRSLLRDLAGRGFRPLLLDWGDPGEDEMTYGLNDYITGPLDAAFAAAHKLCGQKVAIAGYCMGGLLALALADRRMDQVSALVLLATPWDFFAYDKGKTRMLKAIAPNMEQMLDATGFMPVDVLQAMFASFDPNMTPRKFRAFATVRPDSARARDFIALEDWLNDGVVLAGPTARDCLIGWYVENLPDRGEWIMDGEPVRPEDVHVPSLVVIPKRDYIVPSASSEPLLRLLPDATEMAIDGGHIGMMVGGRAKGGLYTPLAKWLEKTIG